MRRAVCRPPTGRPPASPRRTQEARTLLAGLGLDDRLTLVRVGPQVTTVCAACARSDAEHALAALRPGAGQADWAAALSVPLGVQAQHGPGAVETVVISDGAFAGLLRDTLPTPLRFIPVGGAADNRAITTFSARRPPDGSAGLRRLCAGRERRGRRRPGRRSLR